MKNPPIKNTYNSIQFKQRNTLIETIQRKVYHDHIKLNSFKSMATQED